MKLRIPNYSICSGTPVKVDFNENTLEICKSSICYRVTYDLEKRYIQNVYSTLGNYQGVEVGLINYDSSNQFLEKIGGYDKVREIAIKVYKEGILNTWEFDQSHIAERGGNPVEYSNYVLNINMFYSGVTGKNVIQSDTTKEYFNKMVESYYYIMK